MREYNRNDKQVIHSTDLYNFCICPKMSQLGREREINTNNSIADGLILERMLFGDHDNTLEELIKSKKKPTIERFEKEVEILAGYFPKGGNAFQRIEADYKDVILTGEVDYMTSEIFYDLKRTKNFDYWNKKNTLMDFFQGFYYPYVWNIKNNSIPEFKYIVYAYELNLVKTYHIQNPAKQFGRVEELIEKYLNEPFFDPNLSVCLNTGYGICDYLEWCEEGKELIACEVQIVEENLV